PQAPEVPEAPRSEAQPSGGGPLQGKAPQAPEVPEAPRSEPQASEGGPPQGGLQPSEVRKDRRWQEIYNRSLDCVHCGLCLSECPTYRETGSELSSPRGRIYLLRGVAEGRLELGDTVVEEVYLCLDCRACETACPSGVRFGAMLDLVRAEVEAAGLRRGWAKRLERWGLRGLLPHPLRLRLLFGLLAGAQRTGLDRLGLAFLPSRLRELHDLLPPVPPRRERRRLPKLIPAEGELRGRVGLFVGCVMPQLFGDVNAATARVLARNGFEVVVPRDQGCCGALHAHAGDEAFAFELARRNVRAFGAAGVSHVIVNSAGCGAALRDVARWLPDEGGDLAASVRDPFEFLDAEGLRTPQGRVASTVCYDDACHLIHGQGVHEAPRRLLAQIPGLRLVEHDDPAGCCGAAGIYNLTHRRMSQAVLERKMQALAATDPDVIATGNPGCLMQLRAGAAARGLRARVVHPMLLLDEAYR
ncbi:MAG: 4Fe-4S dicluster domain-containing protein, partial [Deltaproteobacteria bacterium]|nr:4Fe-4S dicluster domain-containing protein [Deltaproteobacteria bacterium]